MGAWSTPWPCGHFQLLAAGLLFRALILAPFLSLHRPNLARKLTYLAMICVAGALVAAVLAFDPTTLYPVPYVAGKPWLGLSAIAEQRLAAAVMMAIDMPAVLAAAVWVVSRTRIPCTPGTDQPRDQRQIPARLSPAIAEPNAR